MVAWIGSLALSLCAIPLAWSAIKRGIDHTNWGLLVLWSLGEFCMMLTYWADPVLMLNYVTNSICLVVVWCVRFWGTSVENNNTIDE